MKMKHAAFVVMVALVLLGACGSPAVPTPRPWPTSTPPASQSASTSPAPDQLITKECEGFSVETRVWGKAQVSLSCDYHHGAIVMADSLRGETATVQTYVSASSQPSATLTVQFTSPVYNIGVYDFSAAAWLKDFQHECGTFQCDVTFVVPATACYVTAKIEQAANECTPVGRDEPPSCVPEVMNPAGDYRVYFNQH